MFIFCSQNAASVFESGWSHLTADLDEETKVLTISLYILSLLVRTVGEGTYYLSQQESSELISCYKDRKKSALAEQSQHLPWHWTSALSVKLQMTHLQQAIRI